MLLRPRFEFLFREQKMTLCHLLQEAGGWGKRWGSRSGKSCRAHFRLEDQWNIALCSSRVMLGALWKLPTPVPYFSAWLSCYMGTWPRSGRPSQEIINRTLLWSLAKHASSPTSSLHLCCRSDLYSSDKKISVTTQTQRKDRKLLTVYQPVKTELLYIKKIRFQDNYYLAEIDTYGQRLELRLSYKQN